jgi:hypothetical protein
MKKKAKKLQKYQFGKPQCGPGLQWSEEFQTCVPVYDHEIIPLKGVDDHTFDPNAGQHDKRGTFIPYKNIDTDAIQQGFNYDSDGVYRKNIFTEDKNKQQFSEFFQALNPLLDATRLIAGQVSDIRTNQDEKDRLAKARYMRSRYNVNEAGTNNVPVYLKKGGKYMCQVGGNIATTQQDVEDANLLAKRIGHKINAAQPDSLYSVRDIGDKLPPFVDATGKPLKTATLPTTVPNNIQLTDIQSNGNVYYYTDPTTGYVTQVDPGVVNLPRFRQPKQKGGNIVNTTGYLKNANSRHNPINIIPSGNITTDQMAFPIMANGVPLYPNTGDYQFDSKYVIEHPMKIGGIHIDPKNKGKFNATKKATGKTTEELTHSKNSLTRKRAVFAQNAKKWHHKYQVGGEDEVPEVGSDPRDQSSALLEQGEVFQNQQGSIQKVGEGEDRHEAASGGSPQADVSRVLEDTGDKRNDRDSKLLLVKPAEVKAMFDFKPKHSLTHSKLYEKVLENDAKDIKKVEKKIKANLDYVENKNGGFYAQNSLEENLKLLTDFATKQDRFDQIYDHQEAKKQMYGIDDSGSSNKFGGFKKRYQAGGKDRTIGKLPPYPKTWNDYYDTTKKQQYRAPNWITPEQFYSTPGLVEYMNTLDKVNGIDNDLGKSDDGDFGWRHQAALEKYYPNGQPVANMQPSTLIDYSGDRVVNTNKQLNLPKPATPSTVNEGLGWSAGYGNLMGLIDSYGRYSVPLEQLDAQPIRAHEEDVRPVINANLSDYNAAIQMLPKNTVGYANQANLLSQKYKADNQAVAAVETRNKQKADQVDTINAQAEFQVDQANLQLRDQFQNRVLLGKEKQRQQKFEYLNGIFKAIDERNAFNRNANLALQTTPYFDQYGNFNGQKYQIASKYNSPDGQNVQYIEDRETGQKFRVIYDKDGKLISSTKIVTDNKGTGNYKINVK